MDNSRLKEEIIRHEGVKYEAYLDSLGYPTGGIGHLLSAAEQRAYPIHAPIPRHIVEAWFEEDINTAIQTAITILGKEHFNSLDDTRQRILVNLAFNLGPRLKQFKNTLASLRAHDYEATAQGLENSLWFKQVGRRGREICAAMRTGFYDF